MQYSQQVIDRVRDENDIVAVISQYVSLKKNGGNYFGLCPFHHEKSPSFSVAESKQFYHCFGCGASGNVISFVMKIENLPFPDALKSLAERVHYTLPESNDRNEAENERKRKVLKDVHEKAARFYYESLQTEGKKAAEYLDRREVSAGARKKYGLGYSPGGSALYEHLLSVGFSEADVSGSGLIINTGRGMSDRFFGRLMFPIFDLAGKVVGFGGRLLEDNAKAAKYLNSPDTLIFDKSRNMYSLNYARAQKSESIIVVEGYMDVISLYQAGFRNVCAALGTAFNAKHAAQLSKLFKTVILLFDSDDAGEKATARAIEALRHSGLEIKVLRLRGAKDPDEFIKGYGREAFLRALAEYALPFVEFQISTALAKRDMSATEEKIKFVREAAGILARLDGDAQRQLYAAEIGQRAGVSAEAVFSEVSRLEEKIDLSEDAMLKKEKILAERTLGASKATDDARRGVLRAFAQSNRHEEIIMKNITKEEFVDSVYIKMFETLIIEKSRGRDIPPTSLIDCFTDENERQQAAAVFTFTHSYEDEEKALTDHIKKVKLDYCDAMIAKEPDNIHVLMEFGARKRLIGQKSIRA
ncbi:DNA primase [Clostridia bacterium]|nr:DNA primase [Clostridia bacterium]